MRRWLFRAILAALLAGPAFAQSVPLKIGVVEVDAQPSGACNSGGIDPPAQWVRGGSTFCYCPSAPSSSWVCAAIGGSGSNAWPDLTGGTSGAQAFVVGPGASLTASGGGTIVATSAASATTASTATTLTADPPDCSAGLAPRGVDASGGAVNCTAYQAADSDLTTWAGIGPSANAQSLVAAATFAAMRTLLDLEAGTDFLAFPTGTPTGSKFLRDDNSWQTIPGGGDALTSSPLSQFAATTSAQLAGVLSNETGSGLAVFATSPVLTTPNLGTPLVVTLTNGTGLPLSTGVTGDLPFSNLTQGSALSVLGVTGNATADVASIAAGTDHQVMRRSGTSLTFGAVNLAQSAAVTGELPDANVSDTLTSSLFVGSGSTTTAIDLATAEVAGTLAAAAVGAGLTDAQVSDTLTASLFVGSGSTTTAVDLATAEVAGTLAASAVGTGLTDAQVSDTLTSSLFVGPGSSTTAVDLETAEVAGTLAAARFPALTGDVTTSAGSLTSAIAAGVIVNADVNGSAAIDGSKIVAASASVPGVVTTATQTFAGDKTFNGAVVAASFDSSSTAAGRLELREATGIGSTRDFWRLEVGDLGDVNWTHSVGTDGKIPFNAVQGEGVGRTYKVCKSGCTYTTVQSAVVDAATGCTSTAPCMVKVGDGLFDEQVRISKSHVHLVGNGASSIIRFDNTGSPPTSTNGCTVTVAYDSTILTEDVTIENLHIVNEWSGDDTPDEGGPPEPALCIGREETHPSANLHWDRITVRNNLIEGVHDGAQFFGTNKSWSGQKPRLLFIGNEVRSVHDGVTAKGVMDLTLEANSVYVDSSGISPYLTSIADWKTTGFHYNTARGGSSSTFPVGARVTSSGNVWRVRCAGNIGQAGQDTCAGILFYSGAAGTDLPPSLFHGDTIDLEYDADYSPASGVNGLAVQITGDTSGQLRCVDCNITVNQKNTGASAPASVAGVYLDGGTTANLLLSGGTISVTNAKGGSTAFSRQTIGASDTIYFVDNYTAQSNSVGSGAITNLGALALDDLTDATITTPATGATLIYSGTAWIDGQLDLADSDAVGSSVLPAANVDAAIARLASPVFTGNPTAPTASANDNDTSVATTAYVQTELTAVPYTISILTARMTAPSTVTINNWSLETSSTSTAVNNGTQKLAGLAFDAAADECIQTNVLLPSTWVSTGGVQARFSYWANSASCSGSCGVVWTAQAICLNDGEVDTAFNAVGTGTVTDTYTTGTANVTAITSATGDIDITGCAAGEEMYLRICRDADNGSDTLAVDAALRAVELTLRRSM